MMGMAFVYSSNKERKGGSSAVKKLHYYNGCLPTSSLPVFFSSHGLYGLTNLRHNTPAALGSTPSIKRIFKE